jgi:hypothetical protein
MLYTKDGCTLCDVVVDSLRTLRESADDPVDFSLGAVDITAEGNEAIFERYKYDIPVIHKNGAYFFKHRVPFDGDEAALRESIMKAETDAVGSDPDAGNPDAARGEKRKISR